MTHKHILMVEDDRTHRDFAAQVLTDLNYKVTVADNAPTALARVMDDPDLYDLILMDCEMPDMDGFEAVRAIRAGQIEKGWPYIPVVAFTGNKGEDSRRMCLAAGMDDHLEKDVFLPNWCSALSDILEKWLHSKQKKDI